ILEKVDFVISVSEKDMKFFEENYKIKKSKLILVKPVGNYPKNLFQPSEQNSEVNFSFISSMNWYPNVQGAIFFSRKILPKIVKKFPDAKFYLVGKNPVKNIIKLQKEFPRNIIVTGEVNSVVEYYQKSKCIVIPVFIGPGIKLKVLEAMASGVPTVMTSYVAKDYNLLNKGFCIADTPEEFVENIERILTDGEFALDLSKRQIEWYEKYVVNETENAKKVIRKILER
ncbi:MAG: glycosyltransferase family 4 protein, partial [Fervidobacterium sp.]